jgi:hypothetical protein
MPCEARPCVFVEVRGNRHEQNDFSSALIMTAARVVARALIYWHVPTERRREDVAKSADPERHLGLRV